MKKIFSLAIICLVLCSCNKNTVANEKSYSNKPVQNVEESQNIKNEKSAIRVSAKEEKNNKSNIKLQDRQEKKESIGEYIPFKANAEYKYHGEGMEYASNTQYIEFIQGNKAQFKISDTGSNTIRVIQKTDDEVSCIYFKGEVYYRDNFIKKNLKEEKDILIKAPIKLGNSWKSACGDKRSITAINKSITTRLGNFKALEITTESKDGITLTYYVKDIGFVKSIYIDKKNKDFKVVTELEKISENKVTVEKIKFNYIEPTDKDFVRKNEYINVDLKTNEDVKGSFEKQLKTQPSKELIPCLSKNVKINKMGLKEDGKVAYIDLSEEFVKEMNAGCSVEGEIIECVAYSVGDYYGVKEVLLTINNKPYASGHMLFNSGETIKLD